MPTPTFSGASFQTNPSSPGDNQGYAAVAALTDGRFATVYSSSDLGAGSLRVIIRNAEGSVARAEAIVDPSNEAFVDADNIAITALEGGGFVIAWAERGPTDTNIKHRVYDAAGNAVTGEIHSNAGDTAAIGFASRPDIVGDGQGGFYLVWDATEDKDPGGGQLLQTMVRTAHFGANGLRTSAITRVSDPEGADANAAIAISRDGQRLNMVWDDDLSQESDPGAIRGVEMGGIGIYRADGGEFADFHSDPDVAYSTGNNFMVVWSEFIDPGVYAVHGSINGGAEFKINTSAHTHFAVMPKVVGLASGDFLVVWFDGGFGGNDDVLGQLFSVTGAKIGSEFQISDRISSNIARIEASEMLDGRVVVTWDSSGPGTASEIYSRFVDPRQAASNWVGTAASEQYVGTRFNDSLDAAGGNDRLSGDAGNDTLHGGAGDDTLSGGAGDDLMVGGAGNDSYVVDSANDTVRESDGSGVDLVTAAFSYSLFNSMHVLGALENLTLLDVATAIHATGNDLDNVLTGNSFNNTLIGALGSDRLVGGLGDDTYVLENGTDIVVDSGGVDTITSTISRSLAGYATIERLTLTGTAAINGTGNALANIITGNGAANVLNGGAGVDTLIGGLGDDTYVLDNSTDAIVDTGGIDTIMSTISRTLAAYATIERLLLTGTAAINGTGNALANGISGNSAANLLNGGAGNDVLNGAAGNDTLVGGAGVDSLAGGLDNDVYALEDGADTVTDTGGIDTITTTVTRSLASYAAVERLTLLGTGAIGGTGNALANTITGNAAANALTGGIGNDTLSGAAGNDTLVGGTEVDTLIGGAGDDFFVFNAVLSAANRDVISDFANVAGNNDTIRLENAVFTKLSSPGGLNAAFFRAAATALDANDYVVYNQATGMLSYDSNGNLAGGAVQIATIANKAALTAGDFAVI